MERSEKSPSVLRVEEALSKAGHKGQVKELNLTARSAKDAAASLKVELGAIVKTLVFSYENDGLRKPALALIAGDKTCDVEELKNELKITGKYSRLGANEVKQITGYTIGGVSPVGLSVEIPKVIDISIFRFEQVWCAAGNQFFVFPTSPEDLVSLTGSLVSSKIGISID